MAKIAIFTTFMKFDPWYSLTGIVKDQVRMLTENDNEVFLFVNEQFDFKNNPFADNPRCTVLNSIPFAHLYDYQDGEALKTAHEITAQNMTAMCINMFNAYGIDTVFTHDIIFTGWNKPYAIGIQRIGDALPGINWLHWIHSIPTQFKDWWQMRDYGPNHKLVYPNRTDALRVAENYRTSTSDVRTIPHIKDLRIMFDFLPETCELINAYPALMQADIVQIYPASSDRFEAKRVAEVIKIMAFIKRRGFAVCLFIANQWATTPTHYANLEEYYQLGEQYGLVRGKDMIFSSLHINDNNVIPYRVGIPANILTQLMMLSNLFIFPTSHETFGLVLPEVSLASGALCVLNQSLGMMAEVGGGNTLYLPFGSYTNEFNVTDMDGLLDQYSAIILGRMQENDSVLTRTFMRKRYNYDYLYDHYYEPIMAETKLHCA